MCAQSHYSDVGKTGEIAYISTPFVETVNKFFIDSQFHTCHDFSDSASLWLRRLVAQLEKERSKVIFAMKPHSSVDVDFSHFSSFQQYFQFLPQGFQAIILHKPFKAFVGLAFPSNSPRKKAKKKNELLLFVLLPNYNSRQFAI